MKLKVKPIDQINGKIKISGSKNAALPIIASTLLSKEEVVLYNVPIIDDVITLIEILNSIGVKTKLYKEKNKLIINAKKISSNVVTEKVNKLRASYYLMGVLISRKTSMSMNFPGGCNFVNRPIELHIKAFKNLNIKVNVENKIVLKRTKKMCGVIDFPVVTLGGTLNTIFASIFINGTTTIYNASIEPEVIDTINFLNHLGAKISIDSNCIIINGVKHLHGGAYHIMFDRIEAGSYLFLASTIPNSTITLDKVDYNKMVSVIKVLKEMGNKIIVKKRSITIKSTSSINNINLETGPYPLFPTDLQPIISSTLLKAKGKSKIKDTIYLGRNSHISELQKLGGEIIYNNNEIHIFPSTLIGDIVTSKDLRCSFALIIATCISEGMSIIENIDYIYRGYEKIENKLSKIGLKIELLS